jgi:hypothetical protein
VAAASTVEVKALGPRRGVAAAAVVLAGACLFGCRSLERYDTEGTSAYCGSIVGPTVFQDGFVPDGQPPGLGLSLKLATSTLSTRPGTLSSNDAETGFCREEGRALFENAPLRAIPEMFHDSLSQLEFGEGHVQDFFAWVDSSCQGTMLAVVSLLTNGAVEMRLMKPAAEPPPNAGADQQPGFALFYMEKSDTGCGF